MLSTAQLVLAVGSFDGHRRHKSKFSNAQYCGAGKTAKLWLHSKVPRGRWNALNNSLHPPPSHTQRLTLHSWALPIYTTSAISQEYEVLFLKLEMICQWSFWSICLAPDMKKFHAMFKKLDLLIFFHVCSFAKSNLFCPLPTASLHAGLTNWNRGFTPSCFGPHSFFDLRQWELSLVKESINSYVTGTGAFPEKLK